MSQFMSSNKSWLFNKLPLLCPPLIIKERPPSNQGAAPIPLLVLQSNNLCLNLKLLLNGFKAGIQLLHLPYPLKQLVFSYLEELLWVDVWISGDKALVNLQYPPVWGGVLHIVQV